MADETVLTAETLSRDPIALARTYRRGLEGGLWSSLRSAEDALQKSGIPVSRTILEIAVQASALPSSVLRLFSAIPLTNGAARTLLGIVKRDGMAALLHRSEALNPGEFQSHEALLEALSNQKSTRDLDWLQTDPDAEITEFPLLLAKIYAEGIESGRWITQTEAGLALGVPRPNVVRAIQISTLPVELLSLFSSGDLTFRLGRHLLSLRKSAGLGALINRASKVPDERRPLSSAAALDVLRERGSAELAINPVEESRQDDSPLTLAKKYETGKLGGLWTTMAGANTILRLPRDTVGDAVRVSKLPQLILGLFDAEEISRHEGKKLLSIARTLGPHMLLQNARKASTFLPRPSRAELFEMLAGVQVPPDAKEVAVTFHMNSKGRAAHIRVTGPNIALLSTRLDDIKGWCKFLLTQETGKI
jgi:hypothetical protein